MYVYVYMYMYTGQHVNQVGDLWQTHLNLLEIYEIGPVDTSESK